MTDSLARILEPFAFCCAARPALSRTTLTTSRFEDIESGLRTGDVLLFNDDTRLPNSTTLSARRCAAFFTRILSILPCLAYTSTDWSTNTSVCDDDQYTTPRPAHRIVLQNEWLDWQHAALIVCMPTQQTHDGALTVAEQQQACVFFNNPDTGLFDLKPLRVFLNSIAGARRISCAVRHLIIYEEAEFAHHVHAHRKLVSQRRAHLHRYVYEFQRSLHQQSLAGAQDKKLRDGIVAITSADRLPTTSISIPPLSEAGTRDTLLLMRASMSFTTLYTLYMAQVLRVEPRLIDAAALIQERNGALLQNQMSTDYNLTAERLFIFDPQR